MQYLCIMVITGTCVAAFYRIGEKEYNKRGILFAAVSILLCVVTGSLWAQFAFFVVLTAINLYRRPVWQRRRAGAPPAEQHASQDRRGDEKGP